MIRVGIVGATGYSGVELIRLLAHHPDATVAHLYTSSAAGESLAHMFPHLGDEELPVLEPIDPVRIARENDVVFLATPSGVSSTLTPSLLENDVRVIDLSGDFRLKSPESYRTWYKKEPASGELLAKAVYGLPEWNREQVAAASFIANPGCYPTATLLGMLPLAKSGWAEPDSWIVDAKSGVSGAGRGVSLGVHFGEVNESVSAYKVAQHQHTPEIEQELCRQTGTETIIQFTPHLIPMTRGILATAYARLNRTVSVEDLQQLYQETYADKPFVRIRPFGSHPRTKEVYGTNFCDIALHLDQRTGRVIILSVIDNMVKGAAGQAIQNMNLMLGLDETSGLTGTPVFP
ncbi:N-acetyl-gamma-glutamyl-phosphate reductase [Brevibacillus sp. SYP-B805]|uniref:N-acetyl-gamma-glutamyl-phosphate reductase n=1 Tax=Brevibacillus sp. SYP-B805 TaxID=1578199 RepID=UPI0013EAB745|nr:N-acetyl-gamma-glutamyl-phosphate reductase [Brevibacillus sp. SYP-B805]NGQ95669.1 N-acetyl-gamma-glutamyl-phosphate reductase [Brevibacillus sp. SYP-B805]